MLVATALASAVPTQPPKPTVGYIGLGTMGSSMARHLNVASTEAGGRPALVWNRSPEKAASHAAVHGTVACDSAAELAAAVDVVCLCLSTTDDVKAVLAELPLRPGALVIDCTSGEPAATKALAAELKARGVGFVDAPVSGGPGGASAGTLTSMCGGSEEDFAVAAPWINAWSAKIVHCGTEVGAGDAVKSINNVLNAAHVALAAEGLATLKKLGVAPSVALSVINSSSGKSLQTEGNLPDNVVTRKFGYGFQLGLMRKDVGIAAELVKQHAPTATLIPAVQALYDAAVDELGAGADYTEVVKPLERAMGVEIAD